MSALQLLERLECPDCGHHVERHYNPQNVGCSVGWDVDDVAGCSCLWTGEELDQVQRWLREAHSAGFSEAAQVAVATVGGSANPTDVTQQLDR